MSEENETMAVDLSIALMEMRGLVDKLMARIAQLEVDAALLRAAIKSPPQTATVTEGEPNVGE